MQEWFNIGKSINTIYTFTDLKSKHTPLGTENSIGAGVVVHTYNLSTLGG